MARGSQEEYNPKRDKKSVLWKLRLLAWVCVNNTLFYWSPFFLWGWRRFLLRCFGATIAKTATVGRRARIEAPWNLVMGERSMICNNTWIMCYAPIIIGDQALVGEYCKLLTGSHISNSRSYQGIASPIEIGANAWLASASIVVSGGRRSLRIGEGAIVGAGAVVMTSVRRMTIVVGNPAESVGERSFTED